MYNELGHDSLPIAKVVEGFTFPALTQEILSPSSSTREVNLLFNNTTARDTSHSPVNRPLSDFQPNSLHQLVPVTTGDWVVHVASFKDDTSESDMKPKDDGQPHFVSIERSCQDDEHDPRSGAPTYVSCQSPPSPCTLLTTCAISLDDTSSTQVLGLEDEQQRESDSFQYHTDSMSERYTPTSPLPAQLHRRRSSHKTALELIVEDPILPVTSGILEPLEPCQPRHEEKQLSSNEMFDTTAATEYIAPRLSRARTPRRAFSLSDIRRSRECVLHQDTATATAALESIAVNYAAGTTSITHQLEPISELSTESGRHSIPAPIASIAKGPLAPTVKESQQKDTAQREVLIDGRQHVLSSIDAHHKSSSVSESPASKLRPRTITVQDTPPDAVASIFESSRRPNEPAAKSPTSEIVAYNPRYPHPIIVYAALSGKDTDLSAYFDENSMFVDTLHRRVGTGGRQVLLQDGENVTFPNVNDEAGPAQEDTENLHRRQVVSSIEDGRTGELRYEKGVEDLRWEDDHVFGNSSTSGMNFKEAMQQMNILRNIHITAQQSLTEDRNELLQQASDIFKNVRELKQLTEFVQARQAGRQESPLEHDSGPETKKKSKKSRKPGFRHNEAKGAIGARNGRIQPRFTGLTFNPNLYAMGGNSVHSTTSRERNFADHTIRPSLNSLTGAFSVNSMSPSPPESSYQGALGYSQSYQPQCVPSFPASPVHGFNAARSFLVSLKSDKLVTIRD